MLGGLGHAPQESFKSRCSEIESEGILESEVIICQNNHEMKSQESSLTITIISYGMEI